MPDSPPSERRPVRPRPAVKTATRIAPSRPAAAPTRTRVVAPAGLASALSPTAVRAAQSFLNDRSGLNLAVDGVVGPETLAAAQVFVRRHGLADVKTSVGRTLVRIIDLEADDVAPPASLPVWIFYAGSPKAEADWTTALAGASSLRRAPPTRRRSDASSVTQSPLLLRCPRPLHARCPILARALGSGTEVKAELETPPGGVAPLPDIGVGPNGGRSPPAPFDTPIRKRGRADEGGGLARVMVWLLVGATQPASTKKERRG